MPAGGDPPFGRPVRAHATPLEGYYWRLTDVARGAVVVALCGVSRDGAGDAWGTVAVAVRWPDGTEEVHQTATQHAWADPRRLGVAAGGVLRGDTSGVDVELGALRLRARTDDVDGWPHRLWGGIGAGHLVPGLSQYWLPWCLGARVSGTLRVGGRELGLDGTTAYGEKNWGRGFPPEWWWGQAHGFDGDPGICAAFAGGVLELPGGLRPRATALVVRLPGGRVLRRGEPLVNGVRAEVGRSGWRLRGGGVELVGHASDEEGCVLPVPLPQERRTVPGARQHLAGEVELTVRRRGRLVYRGTSSLAGLERGRPLSSPPWSPVSPTSSPVRSPRTSAPAT